MIVVPGVQTCGGVGAWGRAHRLAGMLFVSTYHLDLIATQFLVNCRPLKRMVAHFLLLEPPPQLMVAI